MAGQAPQEVVVLDKEATVEMVVVAATAVTVEAVATVAMAALAVAMVAMGGIQNDVEQKLI
jgi:hypothetical protein